MNYVHVANLGGPQVGGPVLKQKQVKSCPKHSERRVVHTLCNDHSEFSEMLIISDCPIKGVSRNSEEVCLLHDAQEFLFVDLAIAITVSFIDHLLQLFISHPLTELLGHALQVLEGNLPGLIVIKETECFENLVFWVTIENLMGHHFKEFLIL